MTDATASASRINRHSAKLGEIFPEHMQRPAADNDVIGGTHRDAELEYVLVKVHSRLVEQPPRLYVLVDQPADYRDIPGARLPDYVPHGGTTVSLKEFRQGDAATPEVYAELLRSYDEGVAEFLDLDRVKPNTLGNTRMLLRLREQD